MKHRYSHEDWRLYKAVSRFKHDRIGKVDITVHDNRLTVAYNAVVFFQYDRKDGYWRVDSWGNNRGWFVEKVNACLHAINSECRAFLENGRLGVVHRSGVAAYGVKWFNNRFYMRGR